LLDGSDLNGLLRPGMSVEATIDTKATQLASPHRAAPSKRLATGPANHAAQPGAIGAN